jgi:hypothetical protein
MEKHQQYNLDNSPDTNILLGVNFETPSIQRIDKDLNIKDFYVFNNVESINRRGQKFSISNVASASSNTSTYSVSAQEFLLAVTSLAVAPIIGLPLPSLVGKGKTYIVKDQVGGAATTTITVLSAGEKTIDGSSSSTITTNYGAKQYYSDGNNWFII